MRFRPYAWMPRPLKWLSRVLTVVVVFGLILAGAGVWTVRASFPQLGGELKVDGLTGKVTVYRDQAGMPQIYADTADDLFRAQGYVHAQDRFWEMDFRRHVTAGRLSELFGGDARHRHVPAHAGLAAGGRGELPDAAAETRRYLGAYADGVNAWLEQPQRPREQEPGVRGARAQNGDYRPSRGPRSTPSPGSRRWPGICAAT